MAGKAKVIDASVAFKWFISETNSNEAVRIREQHFTNEIVIHAPDIIIYEVLNALRYRQFAAENIIKAGKDLLDLQIILVKPTETMIKIAAEISVKHNLSVYDAFYAALAQDLGTKLLTFDKELLRLPFSEKP